jgi:hypothetical protein
MGGAAAPPSPDCVLLFRSQKPKPSSAQCLVPACTPTVMTWCEGTWHRQGCALGLRCGPVAAAAAAAGNLGSPTSTRRVSRVVRLVGYIPCRPGQVVVVVVVGYRRCSTQSAVRTPALVALSSAVGDGWMDGREWRDAGSWHGLRSPWDAMAQPVFLKKGHCRSHFRPSWSL